jgi:hypothetical protein
MIKLKVRQKKERSRKRRKERKRKAKIRRGEITGKRRIRSKTSLGNEQEENTEGNVWNTDREKKLRREIT